MEKITKNIIILFSLVGILFATPTALLGKMPTSNIYGKPIVYDKQVYLLDVWATWCPPCKMTIPELVALQEEFASKNFTVIGLSVDDSAKTVLDYLKKNPVNYSVAMATPETLKALPPVRGIPTLFVVDKGVIVKTIVGYTPKETLAEEIRKRIK
jgi:thiol-disulfide isomerase/thioredoxin